jgi:hypothetical protein
MTGLNHAVTGAFVAAAINRPAVALPAALLSHFFADIVPHWDYKLPGGPKRRLKVMCLDLTLSLILLVVLALTVNATPWMIFLGGLLAITPDIMWLEFFLTGRPSIKGNPKRLINRIRRFHLWIQWSETSWGLYVEAAWFMLMLALIYRL